MKETLAWLERGFIAAGIALAAWCAIVLVEARFTRDLPVHEPLRVTQTLPGDEGTTRQKPLQKAAPAMGTVVARLEVPRLNLSTAVLEGTDDATLNRGAGHIEDTPLPGDAGNVGIAGHRDTVFRALRRVKVGDEVDVRTADRVVRYTIARTLIVTPDDVYVLDPTDEPTLTLVTCYPFEFIGHAPKRFIVQAKKAGTK